MRRRGDEIQASLHYRLRSHRALVRLLGYRHGNSDLEGAEQMSKATPRWWSAHGAEMKHLLTCPHCILDGKDDCPEYPALHRETLEAIKEAIKTPTVSELEEGYE
jgi:hypothetical protein